MEREDDNNTPKMKATNRAERQHKRVWKYDIKTVKLTSAEIAEAKARYSQAMNQPNN